MSRAESGARLVDAALRLGVRSGAGALSLQGIATTAGVSKALLLYHFTGKSALLAQLADRLARDAAARMLTAAAAPDALLAWRSLARDELERGELALLAALATEDDARGSGTSPSPTRTLREESGTRLANAIMASVRLESRVPPTYLGRLLVRHVDGLAVAGAHAPFGEGELEAELDTFAIALLGLGK